MRPRKRYAKYFSLRDKINKYSRRYWVPTNEPIENVHTHSWFSITEKKSRRTNKPIRSRLPVNKKANITYAEKILMYPTKKQYDTLMAWMSAYICMYNEAIKLMKDLKFHYNWSLCNWKTVRTDFLKAVKQHISTKYGGVNIHALDFAIQDACSKLKAGITNVKKGHINHFRLRYIKHTKKNKILKIDKENISKYGETFCSTIFKEPFILKKEVDGELVNCSFKDITCDFTIHYNGTTNRFTILNAKKVECTLLHSSKDTISLDPGVRTFQTGYSTSKCVSIGSNMSPKIGQYLDKIDKVINNPDLSQRIKNKVNRNCNRKIQNIVDDLHWKSIRYLISNYGNIVIGNLSTKQIVSKHNRTISARTKRIALLMRLYTFKQRLEYKCNRHRIGYAEIDEAFTSATCTRCGHLKRDLNDATVYNCDKCKLSIGRDYAGARNIMLNVLK